MVLRADGINNNRGDVPEKPLKQATAEEKKTSIYTEYKEMQKNAKAKAKEMEENDPYVKAFLKRHPPRAKTGFDTSKPTRRSLKKDLELTASPVTQEQLDRTRLNFLSDSSRYQNTNFLKEKDFE